jgi:hypothetical protein
MRQQGSTLKQILTANDADQDKKNDLILVEWPQNDLALLKDATIRFLNDRSADVTLSEPDRKDFSRIIESLRTYVSNSNGYWKIRDVPTSLRFQGWLTSDGKKGWDQHLK